jgi:hypothetical protein
MSKILMRRSELESLIESLLRDGLAPSILIESKAALESELTTLQNELDALKNKYNTDKSSELESQIEQMEEKVYQQKQKVKEAEKAEKEESEAPTDTPPTSPRPSPTTSTDDDDTTSPAPTTDDDDDEDADLMTHVRRIADKVGRGVGKAYDATAGALGGLKKGFVKGKEFVKKLSGEDGVLTSLIDLGDSIYDFGATAVDVAGAGKRKLAAIGQDEAPIVNDIEQLASNSAETDAEALDFFITTELGAELAQLKPADNGSFLFLFANTIQELKNIYFANEREGEVPMLQNYGLAKYLALKGKPATFFQNSLIRAINNDLTALVRSTNTFHESVREKSTDLDAFIGALKVLFSATNDESKAIISKIKAGIEAAETKNFEPYVNQVYAVVADLLRKQIPVLTNLITKINEGYGTGDTISPFRRNGQYYSKTDYPALYLKIKPDTLAVNIEAMAEQYDELAEKGPVGEFFAGSADSVKKVGSALNRPASRMLGDLHPNPSKEINKAK